MLHKLLSRKEAHVPYDMEIILVTGVCVGKCQINCYDMDANWANITLLISYDLREVPYCIISVSSFFT
jgi:hypothetical protein